MSKIKAIVTGLIALSFLLPISPASADANCYTPGPDMDLTGCNFVGINLSGFDLSNSNLSWANLTGTNLDEANLANVRAENVVGVPSSLPTDWVLINKFLLGPEANLSSFILNDMDLRNVNLTGADLSYARMTSVNLTNTNLTDATLTEVFGNSIVGTPNALPEDWTIQKGLLIGPTANLSGLSITGVDFRGLNLSGALLNSSNLIDSNLSGLNLQGVGVLSIGLINTNVSDTDFEGVDFGGVRSFGITGTPKNLPTGFVLRSGFLIGPGANLSSANMSNINFTDISLSEVNLLAANLSNTNLAGVDLTSTLVRGANFYQANITGTDFTGVDLTGVVSGNLTGTPIGLSEDWTLFQGFLVGPSANLSTCDWRGLDLRALNLSGVNFVSGNLTGANISGMDLTGMNLRGVNLTGANVTGTKFAETTLSEVIARDLVGTPLEIPLPFKFLNSYLVGPTANLNGADLSGFDLRNMDLSNASMNIAKLNNADLRGATITGAAVQDADLTGAKLLNVISGNLIGTPTGIPSNFTLTDGVLKVNLVLTPVPKITGLAKVGSKLTAATGLWDEGVNLTFQWERNGTPIANANLKTYVPTADDYKKGVSVTVTGTGTGGTTKSKSSLDKPIAVGTMVVKAPKVTGTFAKGKTLKVSATSWVKGAKISYSWLLDGKAIKGATKTSFKILPNHAGKKISVLVKQIAKGYVTATKASKPTKVK